MTDYIDSLWETSLVYTNIVDFQVMDKQVYLGPDGTVAY